MSVLVCVVKCLLEMLLRLCRFEGKRRKLSSESPAGTGSGNEDARATASDIVAEYVAKWVLCAEKSDYFRRLEATLFQQRELPAPSSAGSCLLPFAN